MIKTQRPYFFFNINSRPVQKFKGTKTYVSTGDSENMENGELVSFYNRPSRANVEPKINDVIFAKMANTDKTFLIDERLANYIFSTGFFDISSKNFDPRYLTYLIQSDEFDGYKNAYSEGTTQVSISDKRLKKICVTYETDIQKQKQIADFLDEKVGAINNLIAHLRLSIEKLKDCIFDLIDNEIFYKNKFYDFNEAPNRCTIRPFKNLFYIKKGLDITKENLIDSGIPVISYGQTHNDYYKFWFNPIEKPVPFVDKKYLKNKSCILHKGDFIFADTSEDIKGSADFSMLNSDDLCLGGYHSLICKPRVSINSLFFMYEFMSNIWKDQIKARVDGVKVYSLTQTILKNVKVYIPSEEIQFTIVNNLDIKVKNIQKLIEIKTLKINELMKFKKSLVYECVSGKKEVFL